MKIVVIEDHIMMRGLIVRACRDRFACEQIAETGEGREGVDLCRAIQPDIVLLDLDLPDGDGLDLMAAIRRHAQQAKIVVVTSRTDEYAIQRCLAANVAAYVDKCTQPITVVGEAMDAVANGRVYYSPVVGRARVRLREDPLAFTKILSAREQEVLRLMGEGLTNDEVAGRLDLSPQTVNTFRRNIMAKLGIHTTPHLMRYAIEKGFTRPRPPASTP
jgi:two-component system response regulator NreC